MSSWYRRVHLLFLLLPFQLALSRAEVPHSNSAAKILNRFPEISVVFTHAPGNGHYAATRLVMDRLRELGYQGKFNIYITAQAREKVYHFLPDFDPHGPIEQALPRINAQTRSINSNASPLSRYHYRQTYLGDRSAVHRTPIKRFAIMGGDDTRIPPAAVDSDALLVIQPSGWGTPELRITREGATDGRYDSTFFKEEESLKLKDLPPSPKDPAHFMEEQMKGVENLEKKIPGLKVLARELDHHEILTAYGLSFRQGPKKLAGIVTALGNIQDEGVLELKKGVVVPMISNFNEDEWADFYQHLPAEQHSRLKVLSLQDAHLEKSLRELGSHEVAIVKTGSVSQEVWNYLMSKSTFPPMASGTTGGSFLGRLGKPFINTVGYSSGTGATTFTHIRNISDAIQFQDVEVIEHFFKEARDPHSQLVKDFHEHGIKLQNGQEKVEAIFQKIDTNRCVMNLLREMVGSTSEINEAKKSLLPLVQALDD